MYRTVISKSESLILVLIILFSFASCNNGSKIDLSPKGETKTVVDIIGREVVIPKEPKRVSCFYASTAHMMAMLDVGDRIVSAADGVTRDALMLTKYPEIKNVSTPYNEGSINVEELVKLSPDLVLMKRDLYYKDGEREKLEAIGIPFIVVDYYSIDELKKTLTIMGEAFGAEDKASAYLKYMDDTFALIKERVGNVPQDKQPKAYHALTQAVVTDVYGGFVAETFSVAHVRNTAVEAGLVNNDKSITVTLEEIYKWDPEIILCNEYLVTDYIIDEARWKELSAVKNGKVYTLPIGATRWGHHGSIEPQMGALFIAQLVYPEKFEDIKMNTLVHDYYLNYFNLDFDEETVDKILSGRGMREVSSEFTYE